MKNAFNIIIGGVVFVLGTSALLAFGGVDYKQKISSQLEQAEKLHESARTTACEYIGNLTSSCYKKKQNSCSELDMAEKEYVRAFGTNAYDTCFTADESSGVQNSSVQEKNAPNPLFFGDAGGKK